MICNTSFKGYFTYLFVLSSICKLSLWFNSSVFSQVYTTIFELLYLCNIWLSEESGPLSLPLSLFFFFSQLSSHMYSYREIIGLLSQNQNKASGILSKIVLIYPFGQNLHHDKVQTSYPGIVFPYIFIS